MLSSWVNNTIIFMVFVVIAHVLLKQYHNIEPTKTSELIPPPPHPHPHPHTTHSPYVIEEEKHVEEENPLELFIKEGDKILNVL